jgi:hypothetical protein
MLLLEQLLMIALAERLKELCRIGERRRVHRSRIGHELRRDLPVDDEDAPEDAVLAHQVLVGSDRAFAATFGRFAVVPGTGAERETGADECRSGDGGQCSSAVLLDHLKLLQSLVPPPRFRRQSPRGR